MRALRAIARVPVDLAQGFADRLRRTFLQPRYVLMLALLLGTSWYSLQAYRARAVRDLPVAVVDLDGSRLSRTVRLFLSAAPELRVDGGSGDLSPAEARQALVEGRVAAVVLIPEGLSTDVKRGRHATVTLLADGSNILVGRNAHKAVAKAVGTASAGAQLVLTRKLGERGDRAMARVVPIAVVEDLDFNPGATYTVYLGPGLVLFLLHVYVLVLASSVLVADDAGRPAARKAGALLAVGGVGLGLGCLFLSAWLPAIGIEARSAPAVTVAILALYLAADLLMAWAIAAVVPWPMTALQVTVVVAMLSLMASGVTWPADMFPPALARLSAWVPFTPFASAMQTLLHRETGLGELAWATGALGRQCASFAGVAVAAGTVRRAAGWIRGAARGRRAQAQGA